MRTAIYVYDSASPVEFSLSPGTTVARYEGPNHESPVVVDCEGRCSLGTGIYRVVTSGPGPVRIFPDRNVNYDVVAVVNDKDPWPDPPVRFQTTFANVTLPVLQAFLPSDGKSYSV